MSKEIRVPIPEDVRPEKALVMVMEGIQERQENHLQELRDCDDRNLERFHSDMVEQTGSMVRDAEVVEYAD